jgi:hypothetical protein
LWRVIELEKMQGHAQGPENNAWTGWLPSLCSKSDDDDEKQNGRSKVRAILIKDQLSRSILMEYGCCGRKVLMG